MCGIIFFSIYILSVIVGVNVMNRDMILILGVYVFVSRSVGKMMMFFRLIVLMSSVFVMYVVMMMVICLSVSVCMMVFIVLLGVLWGC